MRTHSLITEDENKAIRGPGVNELAGGDNKERDHNDDKFKENNRNRRRWWKKTRSQDKTSKSIAL